MIPPLLETTPKMPQQPSNRLTALLPPQTAALFVPLLQCAKNTGLGVCGTRGVGKSSLLFLLAWLDAIILGKPTIVITPIPQVIDLFFTNVCSFCAKDQKKIWQRVRYSNLSGQEMSDAADPTDRFILPTPLFYASGIGTEGSFVVSQRLPALLLRLSPRLVDASVQGYQAVNTLATHAGRILFACGLGIEQMDDLLQFPESEQWQARFRQAVHTDPSVGDAVSFFQTTYLPLSRLRRFEYGQALRSRLSLFADPITKAQFGGTTWALPWNDVFAKKLIVFVDISQRTLRGRPAVSKCSLCFSH